MVKGKRSHFQAVQQAGLRTTQRTVKRVAEKGGNSPEKGIVSVPFQSSTHTLSQVAPCFPPLFTMTALGR